MSQHYYPNVPVSVRSTADGSSVAFGVEINGGFFPFHFEGTGGFEDDLATIAEDTAQFFHPAAPDAPSTPAA